MSTQLILLVDDEVNITELAGLYLKREGFEVEAVHDGLAAQDSIKRLQPALVVLDLMLPGLDGLEVCKKTRAANNQVPILMLTAKDEDIDKIIGLELGRGRLFDKTF